MNWRILTLDRAILQALENGFNDPDFLGWSDLPADGRQRVIDVILQNNGVAQIIFRHSFAKALWPTHWEKHLQYMVINPDWLKYLRDNT